MGDKADQSGALYTSLAFAVMGLIAGLVFVTRMIGPASIPIWGVSLIALMVIGNGPVGKAMARRISGEGPEGAHLDVPEEVYAELDELRARMLEMEERQDFAERMLAGRPDGGQLTEGGTS